MEKTLKKNILTLPTDSLPVRTKKAIAVTQAADGTVTNIEAVYPDGKRVDLDGNVQGTKSVTITANDTYTVSPDATYTSLRQAVVSVAVPTGTEVMTAVTNGTYTPTSPNIGFSSVEVAVPNGTEVLTAVANDTYTPTAPNIGFSSVVVNVPAPVLGTLNATANNTYTPTSPAVGFSSVSVAVAPVQLTQAQYDALTTKDPNTIYAILG